MLANWIRQTRRTYFGNATAQRDFRVQLRGNRSIIVFGLYLAILIGVAYLQYSSVESQARFSLTNIQYSLKSFYQTIMGLLGGMVVLITPALAATAVITERQRRSLDLVFSAPVEPRYYLVGKLIAVYRYIWMLLILALPVAAACVVLGGSNWLDVFTAFILLSFHGLAYAALGLYISAISDKLLGAIGRTYIAVLLLVFVTYVWSGAGNTFGATGRERSFTVAMSPFSVADGGNTFTVLSGIEVPNWILVGALVLVFVRMCLLGAGSVLSDGREIKNLRMSWTVIFAVISFASRLGPGGITFFSSGRGPSTSFSAQGTASGLSLPTGTEAGMTAFWILFPLIFSIFSISAFGTDGHGWQRPNGWFTPKEVFSGTPAGALPYVLLLTTVTFGGHFAANLYLGSMITLGDYLSFYFYAISFWSLLWAVTRLASAYCSGLKATQTSGVLFCILFLVAPPLFFGIISAGVDNPFGQPIWNFYALRPVLLVGTETFLNSLTYGVLFLVVAAVFYALSVDRTKQMTRRTEEDHA